MFPRTPLSLGGLLFFAMLLIACSDTRHRKRRVDLILFNACIYTLDAHFTTTEALVVEEGRLLDLGTTAEILKKYRSRNQIDAEGLPVYPGFYDAHAHFFGLGQMLSQCDLSDSRSMEEVVARLRQFREENPEATWIIGRGWDQNLFPDGAFPDKKLLDEAFPNVPVYLSRIDGHAALVNQKALQFSGLVKPRPVYGGTVGELDGRLTGLLIDNAMDLVREQLPKPGPAEQKRQLLRAEEACFSVGLTTIADAGLTPLQIEFLKALYRKKELEIRNYAMVMYTPESLSMYLDSGFYKSEKLNVRSFKILADGALGSRGACLLKPYQDAPDRGHLIYSPETLDSIFGVLAHSFFQVNTHAIGDSTNRLILNLYGKHLQEYNDRRWRIEHVQVMPVGGFQAFEDFSLIPSVQPSHAISDMEWAEGRLGAERMQRAYAYRDLQEIAGKLAFGSDFPVEHWNPLYGFHAAIARVDEQGMPPGGFYKNQAISREDALRAMTVWAAYACFEEGSRGSLVAGKKADFVILDKDIMLIPEDQIRQVRVLKTFVDGKEVFSLEKF